MACGVVGDLIGGAVWTGSADVSTEAVVLVGGDAPGPIGDSFEQVAGVVGVVDLFACRVGGIQRVSDAGQVVVGIIAVLDQIPVGGEGFEPGAFVVIAGDDGCAFSDGFKHTAIVVTVTDSLKWIGLRRKEVLSIVEKRGGLGGRLFDGFNEIVVVVGRGRGFPSGCGEGFEPVRVVVGKDEILATAVAQQCLVVVGIERGIRVVAEGVGRPGFLAARAPDKSGGMVEGIPGFGGPSIRIEIGFSAAVERINDGFRTLGGIVFRRDSVTERVGNGFWPVADVVAGGQDVVSGNQRGQRGGEMLGQRIVGVAGDVAFGVGGFLKVPGIVVFVDDDCGRFAGNRWQGGGE